MVAPERASETGLLHAVDELRRTASALLDDDQQAALGQYFTPAPIARFMASLFPPRPDVACLRLLDAGAGIGMLTAAWIEAVCAWPHPPAAVHVTLYEVDAGLIPTLQQTLRLCRQACAGVGLVFSADIRQRDFVQDTVAALSAGMFGPEPEQYDCAIMNPPYFKIHSQSAERGALRRVGIETSNIYTGFLALALRVLTDNADFVAITPRSYCNGRYFFPFRRDLLAAAALRRFHLFARRDRAFRDDAVLQETVIAHVTVGLAQPQTVTISESVGTDMEHMRAHRTPFARVVHPGDRSHIIHLASNSTDHMTDRLASCTTPLGALGLTVSTGRVVAFRARRWLREAPSTDTVPLIHPEHCVRGDLIWPKERSKKAQAIVDSAESAYVLVPSGVYVLVKRFSAKEERRRVVASVYDPVRQGLPGERVGFENHLNYYHCGGKPLPLPLARGLAAFLNSTAVDEYFRTWSGSTQVNAGDLRKLRYPPADVLAALGTRVGPEMPEQEDLDQIVETELLGA